MRKTHRTWTQKDIRLPKTAGIIRHQLVSSWPPSKGESKTVSALLRRGNRTGGADRDRTDDLRLAKPALSQLSYSPTRRGLEGIGPDPSSVGRAWWAWVDSNYRPPAYQADAL